MPNYKGHLAGGTFAFALVLLVVMQSYHPSFLTGLEWFLCALGGSLFPDIDVKSKGQKYFYWAILGVILVVFFKQRFDLLMVVSVCAVIPMLAKHRGLFHRLWFVVLGPLLLWAVVMINYPMYRDVLFQDVIFFIVGAISHLWLDLGFKRMMRV